MVTSELHTLSIFAIFSSPYVESPKGAQKCVFLSSISVRSQEKKSVQAGMINILKYVMVSFLFF